MSAQDCLHILREVKEAAFATVDIEGNPQNRIIDIMGVENQRVLFCTARGKNFYKEIVANPHVAITAMNTDFQMVRLQGSVVRLEDNKSWIDTICKNNPSLLDIYPGDSRYILEAFCIDKGEIELFDLKVHPIHRETFALGNISIKKKGFLIEKSCIECDLCAHKCPQTCIIAGTPYKIKQSQCLHCGLCFENCPVTAISRL